MKSENRMPIARRRVLTLGAASAGIWGLGNRSALGADSAPEDRSFPQELFLALLRNYRTAKSSSYDRTGGNADARKLDPGKALTLLEADGPGMFMEATGRGHIVGVTHGIVLNQDGWWGEGDDMLFVDGSALPVTNGTGSEDYYNGAWGFDGKEFHYRHIGVPYVVNPFTIGGRWCCYRWHLDAPLAFEKSARFTIEHGTGNNRSDNMYSVAYWYQTEPHASFPPLPPVHDRLPRVFAVPEGAAPVTAAADSAKRE
jgi:hypothetical protein